MLGFLNTKTAQAGDTIVEVLIAISIAGFAIGISYATANRSLQQAILARERNEAVNVIENQIADLKFRHQKTPTNSFGTFTYPSVKHFCLDDSAADPTAGNWAPINNFTTVTESSPLAAATPPAAPAAAHPYNSACVNNGKYYIDIATQSVAGTNANPTIYQVIVRWTPLTGKAVEQASVYYRF